MRDNDMEKEDTVIKNISKILFVKNYFIFFNNYLRLHN